MEFHSVYCDLDSWNFFRRGKVGAWAGRQDRPTCLRLLRLQWRRGVASGDQKTGFFFSLLVCFFFHSCSLLGHCLFYWILIAQHEGIGKIAISIFSRISIHNVPDDSFAFFQKNFDKTHWNPSDSAHYVVGI